MKLLSITLLAVLSFSSSFCPERFEIIETTSQKWFGGVKGSGYGTKYEINIIPKTNSEALRFDQIWIGDTYFPVSTFQKGKRIKNNTFSPGDTVTINFNHRFPHEPQLYLEEGKPTEESFIVPQKYKGEALLSYTFKGKRKYIEIEKFTVLKELQYP